MAGRGGDLSYPNYSKLDDEENRRWCKEEVRKAARHCGFSGLILTDWQELEHLLQDSQIEGPKERLSLEAHFNLFSILLGSSVLRSSFKKAASFAQEKGYPIIFLRYAKEFYFGFRSQVQYELVFYDLRM